jgi:hypothetical protein
MEKVSLILLLILVPFESYSYNGDTVKYKKFNIGIETGLGININSQYFAEDPYSMMTSNNKTKFNINLVYDISKKIKFIGFIEHSKQYINQTIIFESSSHHNFKHKLHLFNLKFSFYTKLLKDTKSNLFIGMGFGSSKYLSKKAYSNVKNVKIDNDNKPIALIASPFQRFFQGVNISMLYEYQLKRMNIGLKYDFTIAESVRNNYTLNIDNLKVYDGSYLPSGMNCEFSLIITSHRK